MSKPQIKLTKMVQDFDKTEKNEQQLKQSSFLLTINTNQSYKLDDPNFHNDIKVFDELLSNQFNNLDQFVQMRDGDVWDDETIKDVDVDYVIERGGKGGLLHSHVFVKITHKSHIRIDCKKIQSNFRTELGLKNVYVNIRAIRNAGGMSVQNYLEKYVKKNK